MKQVVVSLVLVVIASQLATSLQADQTRTEALEAKRDWSWTQRASGGSDEQGNNEIDETIKIGGAYKSMIESSARFALAQLKVTNIINIDTAVRLLAEVSALLFRPAFLTKLIRLVAAWLGVPAQPAIEAFNSFKAALY